MTPHEKQIKDLERRVEELESAPKPIIRWHVNAPDLSTWNAMTGWTMCGTNNRFPSTLTGVSSIMPNTNSTLST